MFSFHCPHIHTQPHPADLTAPCQLTSVALCDSELINLFSSHWWHKWFNHKDLFSFMQKVTPKALSFAQWTALFTGPSCSVCFTFYEDPLSSQKAIKGFIQYSLKDLIDLIVQWLQLRVFISLNYMWRVSLKVIYCPLVKYILVHLGTRFRARNDEFTFRKVRKFDSITFILINE